jgi:hypothetical protein
MTSSRFGKNQGEFKLNFAMFLIAIKAINTSAICQFKHGKLVTFNNLFNNTKASRIIRLIRHCDMRRQTLV